MDIGPREIIILAIIVLLLFGLKRIPDLAKGIKESIHYMRGAFNDDGSPPIAKR